MTGTSMSAVHAYPTKAEVLQALKTITLYVQMQRG